MSFRSIESFLNVLSGKTFIKSYAFADELKTLFIHFYNSYSEYKSENPNTLITEAQYLDYFGTFNKIEKWIVLEPARVLRDFKEIDCIEVTLPFEKDTYHATIHRYNLNKYLGFDITTIDPNDKSWQTLFSDVYGYGFNNSKRRDMFNHFTKKN